MNQLTKLRSKPFLLAALAVCGGWAISDPMSAQTFRTLRSFTSPYGGPQGRLVLSGNTLYGTTAGGGTSDGGTVFAINTDGTGFRTLHNFAAPNGGFNSDGFGPADGLILSGNTLYGTTGGGGIGGSGTVFAVNTDGTAFMNLYNFNEGTNGSGPNSGLILSGTTLFGTTGGGGTLDNFHNGSGTVFVINVDGTGFQTLYSFTPRPPSPCPCINSDGANPRAGLILSANTLYGTTSDGGSGDSGTVFALNTDGTGFTNLYSFSALVGVPLTNSDGAFPYSGLTLSGNTLFGTTYLGGTSAFGTVFALNTDGTSFSLLHTFTAKPYADSSDGAEPLADLILSGSTLYGTTRNGGSSGSGTVFALNSNGSGFEILHSFGSASGTNSDGQELVAGLTLSGTTLYGTSVEGGAFGAGTVFSLSFAPTLTIAPSGSNVVLTWPTNLAGFDYTGYSVESTTNFVLPAVWRAVSAIPVIVNGQNTVTNPISGTQQFYRLTQ